MKTGRLSPPQTLAREAQDAARAVLWRFFLVGLATLIGTAGLGFLLFAAFDALRPALGPGLAAGIIGAGLAMATAGLLLAALRATRPGQEQAPADQPPAPPPPVAFSAADGVAMAAFTVAFVIGRYLADRARG